jgi:phospholipid/cholesterol/gamma-HCH transport system permease protein
MAAELGTMKVTEQIDALRTLIRTPRLFVIPRMAATTLAMPALVCEAVAVGILGGYLLACMFWGLICLLLGQYGFNDPCQRYPNGYNQRILFGALISFIGCYKGLNCKNGAQGVGIATTDML